MYVFNLIVTSTTSAMVWISLVNLTNRNQASLPTFFYVAISCMEDQIFAVQFQWLVGTSTMDYVGPVS